MLKIIQRMSNTANNSKGATLVEYAVMLALIIIVALTAIQAVGSKTSNKMGAVNTAMN